MRRSLFLFVFAATLAATTPSQAQLRADASALVQGESARLMDSGVTLSTLFSPNVFRMSHSYEMSAGSVGGAGYSLGMYTNTMQWQFSNQLAARVDVAMAHSPFGGADALGLGTSADQPFRVFVRNAEVAYRPTESLQLNFSYRQSPFGAYASPYGTIGGGRAFGHDDLGHGRADRLFWRGATGSATN
jgi:hypothetical protein